jgi:hypothetical protein
MTNNGADFRPVFFWGDGYIFHGAADRPSHFEFFASLAPFEENCSSGRAGLVRQAMIRREKQQGEFL